MGWSLAPPFLCLFFPSPVLTMLVTFYFITLQRCGHFLFPPSSSSHTRRQNPLNQVLGNSPIRSWRHSNGLQSPLASLARYLLGSRNFPAPLRHLILLTLRPPETFSVCHPELPFGDKDPCRRLKRPKLAGIHSCSILQRNQSRVPRSNPRPPGARSQIGVDFYPGPPKSRRAVCLG